MKLKTPAKAGGNSTPAQKQKRQESIKATTWGHTLIK